MSKKKFFQVERPDGPMGPAGESWRVFFCNSQSWLWLPAAILISLDIGTLIVLNVTTAFSRCSFTNMNNG